VHTGVWWENLKETGHSEGLGIDGRIILKQISNKCGGGVDWIDLALRMGTGGGLLLMQ
jgi:hypothetical protein